MDPAKHDPGTKLLLAKHEPGGCVGARIITTGEPFPVMVEGVALGACSKDLRYLLFEVEPRLLHMYKYIELLSCSFGHLSLRAK